jgi:hypothetical protein
MTITGTITNDGKGNLVAYVLNDYGNPLEIGTEQIDFAAFSSTKQAKEDARRKLCHNVANALYDAALLWRSGHVETDLD